jgi:C1A family cysteine protease
MTDTIIKSAKDKRDYVLDTTFYSLPSKFLPKSVDLRSFNRDVEDQGERGSCGAHALTNCIELMTQRMGTYENLSREFAYYIARESSGDLGKDGTTLRDALKMAQNVGISLESDWPYSEANDSKKPSPKAYASAALRTVTSYEQVPVVLNHPGNTIVNLQVAVAKGLPVIIAAAVSNKFVELQGPMLTHAKKYNGLNGAGSKSKDFNCNHAMLIVGYHETLGFIVENSWGTGWGHKGYGLLPYEYANDIIEAWVVTSFKGLKTESLIVAPPLSQQEFEVVETKSIFTVLASLFGAIFAKKKA